jgi:pheromone shutdown protein TraB
MEEEKLLIEKQKQEKQEKIMTNLIRREYNKALRNLFIFGIILLVVWIILNSVLPSGLAMGIINITFLLASLIWGGFLSTAFKLVLPSWLSVMIAIVIWALLFIGIRSLF